MMNEQRSEGRRRATSARVLADRAFPDRLEPADTPDWMVPRTVEGIGFALAEAVYSATGCPAAVVVRDPATETATVVAASAGADRRLLGSRVGPTSAAGRACIGNVISYGTRVLDLLGGNGTGRRQREAQGVAFSLMDARRSVGAIVVFAPPALIDRTMNDLLAALAQEAGRAIGRTMAVRHAERRGLIDAVTGQLNREGLQQAISDSIQPNCALVCADVDPIAQLDRGMVNAALKQIAGLLRHTLRDYDIPARIDKDEFALFLPGTALDHAMIVADRVRMAIATSELNLGERHTFSSSLGVVSVPDTVPHASELLDAATAALLQAKTERNRVVVAHPV